MKKFLTFIFIAVISFICVAVSGCNATFNDFSFSAFNTEIYITVKGKIPKNVKDEIQNLVYELENEFSLTKSSKIKTVNDGDKNTEITLSDNGMEIFNLSKKYYSLTNKKFNPAILPLTQLWKLSSETFNKGVFSPPSSSEIENIKPYCKFDDFVLSSNGKITKLNAQNKADFGGIVKGFTSDKIYEILINNGFSEGYVSVGGSSLNIITVPHDLKISHPRKSGEYIISVNKKSIKNTPLSTSGDYERYYDFNGKRYCHVIDTNTGAPIDTNISSATVFGVSGSFADALSTAVCCHNTTDNSLVNFINSIVNLDEYKMAKFIVIDSKNNQVITNFSSKEITLHDKNFTLYYI